VRLQSRREIYWILALLGGTGLVWLVVALQADVSGGAPRAILTVKEHVGALGTVALGSEPQVTFTIKNEGSGGPARLLARAGCGCFSLELNPSVIRPGESSILTVSVSTAGREGRLSKRVHVWTAGGGPPLVLRVHADVRAFVRCVPESLVLVVTEAPGRHRPSPGEVARVSWDAVKYPHAVIADVRTPSFVEATVVDGLPLSDATTGWSYQDVLLRPLRTQEGIDQAGDVLIYLEGGARPAQVVVRIRLRSASSLLLGGRLFDFGVMRADRTAPREVTVASRSGGDPIVSVSASGVAGLVEANTRRDPLRAGGWIVEATPAPGARGSLSTELVRVQAQRRSGAVERVTVGVAGWVLAR
jgi:hypothetical protein